MPGLPERIAPALAFGGVVAGYPQRAVLHGVSVEIAEGEFIAVIGPNGSGKSTFLKAAAGLLRPEQGSVELFGRPVASLKPRERASLIGVVPQKLDSPMAFTVAEIVAFGLSAASRRWGAPGPEGMDRVERAMIYTNVLDLKERLFNELSAGEQQRTALAMALVQEPRVIMLDESIAHLDINHSQEVLRILMNLNRERKVTVLLVSHDLNLAAQVADRLLLVDEGRIVKAGSPEEVLEEGLLSRIYGCELRVRQDPYGGHPVVTGVLENHLRRPALRRKVHVVSGGGSGIELFRRLLIEGFDVSAGVLNQLDSDAEAARALGIPCVLEQPFSPIGKAACDEARLMVAMSDAVVVGRVPFGSGNVVNLELASGALEAGKPVWIASGIGQRDYTDGRAAESMAGGLMAGGAGTWAGMQELMSSLHARFEKPQKPSS